MKHFKRLLALIFSLLLMSSVCLADGLDSLEPVGGRITISGKLSQYPNTKLVIMVLYPGMTQADVQRVNEGTLSFNQVINNILEANTAADGSYVAAEYAVGDDHDPGKYSILIRPAKINAIATFYSDAFTHVPENFKQTVLTKLDGSVDSAADYVNTNLDFILTVKDSYDALGSSSSKLNALKMAVNERDKCPAGSYSSYSDGGVNANFDYFVYNIKRSVFIQSMLEANIDRADSILISNLNNFGLDKLTPLEYYKNDIELTERKAILKSVLEDSGNKYIDDYTNSLAEKAFFKVAYGVDNYADIETVLSTCEAWLGINLSSYKAITDKSELNEKIVKANLHTKSAFVEFVVKAVSEAKGTDVIIPGDEDSKKPVTNPPSYGGGGGGGGGGGISFPNPEPPITEDKTDEENKGEENIPPKADGAPFGDLENHKWAKSAIDYLYEKGIVNGVDSANYAPELNVKREEFVKLLYMAFYGEPEVSDTGFDDVRKDDWFAPYVADAVKKGLVNGISEARFGSGEYISRQDMAVMAYRFARENGLKSVDNTEAEFNDSKDIASYAKEAVAHLKSLGVINGMGDGSFAPGEYSDRAQAAQIVYNLITKGIGGDVDEN